MRLRPIIITTAFFLFLPIIKIQVLAACNPTTCTSCTGYCGTQSCTYSHNAPDNGVCENNTDPPMCITYTCNDSGICNDPNDPYNWNPTGGVCCDARDCSACSAVGGNCLYETADVLCNCDPNVTSTPNPNDPGDPGDPGSPGDPTATPTPTPPPTSTFIQGSIQLDTTAALSGNYCTQATTSPLNLTGLSLNATKNASTYPASFLFANTYVYSINTSTTGTGYTVTLNLAGQTGGTNYVCSCPAPADPNNPYLCRYTGVTSPTANVNFYLREYNLSNDSWFQVFGSNYFADSLIQSPVPHTACENAANCTPALSAPIAGSSNLLSTGFAIVNTSNATAVRSHSNSVAYHSYFHPSTRPSNLNSYALNADLSPLSYEYFLDLAENDVVEIGNGEDLEPLLSDFTSAPWWKANEVNYVKVNGNVSIDESQGFQLSSSQQLVLFVDGRLTFDDSNPSDTNRKVTSVASGGFLAFISSGDIWITPNVGYALNPAVPTVPAVTVANSNLEGVFIANNNLLLQSKTAIGQALPDRKFIGAGTFVGWNNILLNRTFNDGNLGPILNNNQAIENFIYRSDLLVNWPVKLKASTSNWREVDPQLIEQ